MLEKVWFQENAVQHSWVSSMHQKLRHRMNRLFSVLGNATDEVKNQ